MGHVSSAIGDEISECRGCGCFGRSFYMAEPMSWSSPCAANVRRQLATRAHKVSCSWAKTTWWHINALGSTSKHVLAAYLPRCALLPYLVLGVNLLPYWILAYALAFVAIWHIQAPSGNPQLHGPLAFCLFVLGSESASATAPDLSPSTASSTTDQRALLLGYGVWVTTNTNKPTRFALQSTTNPLANSC
jgi:hypothetical protein